MGLVDAKPAKLSKVTESPAFLFICLSALVLYDNYLCYNVTRKDVIKKQSEDSDTLMSL